jgi:GT2 family glycosyltransferase
MREITKIAVLLTCFNRKAKTLRSLKALMAQSGLDTLFDLKVFLVDDGSKDGTSEAVKHQFPDVNIITGDGNLYWNRGMHRAWVTAIESDSFDYYLWLNDDTNLKPDAINELLECAKHVDEFTLICGATCSEVSGEFTYGGTTKQGKPIKPNGSIQTCEIIQGNCVLISQFIYEKIGTLDPVFPHAIGDLDYGLRLVAKGGTICTAKKYIGYCERNDRLPKWCYNDTPILERYKTLYSPLGYSHPKYFFIYEQRHFGLFTALKHYFSIHLRATFPSLWKSPTR